MIRIYCVFLLSLFLSILSCQSSGGETDFLNEAEKVYLDLSELYDSYNSRNRETNISVINRKGTLFISKYCNKPYDDRAEFCNKVKELLQNFSILIVPPGQVSPLARELATYVGKDPSLFKEKSLEIQKRIDTTEEEIKIDLQELEELLFRMLRKE